MKKTPSTRKLVLIEGGPLTAGPVTRMNLWYRYPKVSWLSLGLILSAKLLFLSTLWWFVITQ